MPIVKIIKKGEIYLRSAMIHLIPKVLSLPVFFFCFLLLRINLTMRIIELRRDETSGIDCM